MNYSFSSSKWRGFDNFRERVALSIFTHHYCLSWKIPSLVMKSSLFYRANCLSTNRSVILHNWQQGYRIVSKISDLERSWKISLSASDSKFDEKIKSQPKKLPKIYHKNDVQMYCDEPFKDSLVQLVFIRFEALLILRFMSKSFEGNWFRTAMAILIR